MNNKNACTIIHVMIYWHKRCLKAEEKLKALETLSDA